MQTWEQRKHWSRYDDNEGVQSLIYETSCCVTACSTRRKMWWLVTKYSHNNFLNIKTLILFYSGTHQPFTEISCNHISVIRVSFEISAAYLPEYGVVSRNVIISLTSNAASNNGHKNSCRRTTCRHGDIRRKSFSIKQNLWTWNQKLSIHWTGLESVIKWTCKRRVFCHPRGKWNLEID